MEDCLEYVRQAWMASLSSVLMAVVVQKGTNEDIVVEVEIM